MRRPGRRQEIDLTSIPDYRESMTLERAVDLQALRKVFEGIIENMPANYRAVIRLLFGFNPSGISLTVSEAARVLKTSPERIHCLLCLFISRVYARYKAELGIFVDGGVCIAAPR